MSVADRGTVTQTIEVYQTLHDTHPARSDPAGAVAVRPLALGIEVTPMTALETVEWIARARGKHLLLNHNLHSAYVFQQDPRFRELYGMASRVVVDGAPILWGAKRSVPGLNSSHRIGSTDWLDVLDTIETGRLFMYGAAATANADAVRAMRSNLADTDWEVQGIDGFSDRAAVIGALDAFRPTLVVVGLGMPLQENFLLDEWDRLPDAVYATVGGAIDYVAGYSELAPRWMGRFGVEWVWRLAHAPKRLGHRYLIEPFKLAWSLVRRDRQRTDVTNI